MNEKKRETAEEKRERMARDRKEVAEAIRNIEQHKKEIVRPRY